jgi:hypothetical protein
LNTSGRELRGLRESRCGRTCDGAFRSCRMHQEPLIERGITSDVIGAFFEVYNNLGLAF